MKTAARKVKGTAEYSVQAMKNHELIRNHLKHYNVTVLKPLSKADHRKIEHIVATVNIPDEFREPYRERLTREAQVVFTIDVLGLDKAEAIGRVMSMLGDAKTEKKWRIEIK